MLKKRFGNSWCLVLIALLLSLYHSPALAFEEKKGRKAANGANDLAELKARVEKLEGIIKDVEVFDEIGHKLHPIHSVYGLKIGGGITMTVQGAERQDGTSASMGALSADITLESPVGEKGRAVAALDMQRGTGLQKLPPFFTAPNGNTTGPDNDIESFDNDQIHLAQLYYEHSLLENLIISVGQLDATAYFDANKLANNERVHFLANQFANNPTVEFAGSENFYGPGLRITYSPVEQLDITLGWFEGDGNYADMFEKPFFMGEVGLKLKPSGREGNYRLYSWSREGRPAPLLANLANPSDPELFSANNSGIGISLDQELLDAIGVWLRGGIQKEQVAQFDKYIGGGIQITGEPFGRSNDKIGLGYGITFMGKDYKDYKKISSPSSKAGDEHYIELYYNISVSDAPQYKGFHMSPDLQYIINPGGDMDAKNVFVYGMRLQTFF